MRTGCKPRSRRLLRNVFGNGPYIEGWAVYTQQLMAEQGYLADTAGYRLTLQKQLLRVLANTILDIRLQTLGMTDREAMDLMTRSTYQETEEATAKLQRGQAVLVPAADVLRGIQGMAGGARAGSGEARGVVQAEGVP